MDDQRIRQIVREEIQRNSNTSRFALSNTNYHTHNGIDSQLIKQENIVPSISVSGNIDFAQETDYTINLNSSFTPSRVQLYGVAYSISGTITFNLTTPRTTAAGTIYTISGLRFTVQSTVVSSLTVVMSAAASPPPSSGSLSKVSGTGTGDTPLVYSSFSDGSSIGVRCHVVGSANLGPSFYLQPDTDTSVVTGNIQYPFNDPNLNQVVPLQSSSYVWVQSSNIFKALSGEGHIVDVYASGTIYARATITQFSRSAIVINVSDLEPTWVISANIVIT